MNGEEKEERARRVPAVHSGNLTCRRCATPLWRLLLPLLPVPAAAPVPAPPLLDPVVEPGVLVAAEFEPLVPLAVLSEV